MQYEVTLKILVDSPFEKERVTHQVKCLFEFGTIAESLADGLGLGENPRLSSVTIKPASTGRYP
jgi:hypothetical protein